MLARTLIELLRQRGRYRQTYRSPISDKPLKPDAGQLPCVDLGDSSD
jgi:hypothetical protein